MKQPLSKKRIDFLKGPALGVLYMLKHLRSPLLLASITAALMAGTIGVLCYLFSFFMEPDLLTIQTPIFNQKA